MNFQFFVFFTPVRFNKKKKSKKYQKNKKEYLAVLFVRYVNLFVATQKKKGIQQFLTINIHHSTLLVNKVLFHCLKF